VVSQTSYQIVLHVLEQVRSRHEKLKPRLHTPSGQSEYTVESPDGVTTTTVSASRGGWNHMLSFFLSSNTLAGRE
jgi:hypothetical protein